MSFISRESFDIIYPGLNVGDIFISNGVIYKILHKDANFVAYRMKEAIVPPPPPPPQEPMKRPKRVTPYMYIEV